MVLSLRLENNRQIIPETELALRSRVYSSTAEEINLCQEQLNVNCKIMTQNINIITSGDIVYEQDGVTVFNGGNSYYNIALSIWSEFQGTRVCLIGTNGEIGVHTICAI